jgi:hypothetical protein
MVPGDRSFREQIPTLARDLLACRALVDERLGPPSSFVEDIQLRPATVVFVAVLLWPDFFR